VAPESGHAQNVLAPGAAVCARCMGPAWLSCGRKRHALGRGRLFRRDQCGAGHRRPM